MALNLQVSHPLRSYQQLVDLVRAIHLSDDPGGENSSVEWKSFLDFSKASGAFHAARAILGFANRPVASASRQFGGLGFLVVGVEPGALCDMPRWDGEKLEPAIGRYLGPGGPSWSHHNVTVDGTNVVVFTVEAPVAGDPIYTLRKAFASDTGEERKNAAENGTIFVRHGGRTERASSADVEELQKRLVAGPGAPDISVSLDAPDLYRTAEIQLRVPEVDQWVDRERDRLLRPMKAARPRSSLTAASLKILTSEQRSQAEYEQEIEKYLRSYRVEAPALLRHAISKTILENGPLRLGLRNEEQEAISDVLVEISTSLALQQFFVAGNWREPEKPRIWGQDSFMYAPRQADLSALINWHAPEPERQGDRWVTRQEIGVLHGETTVFLEPFTVLTEEPARADAAISVRVTAGDRRGSARFAVPIAFSPVGWSNLDRTG